MDWCKCLDGFELYNETARDKHVELTRTDLTTLVINEHRNLSLERHPLQPHLDAERMLINRLEKPRPENTMDLDRTFDHSAGVSIEFVVGFSGGPGVLAFHILFSDAGGRGLLLK